MINKEKYIEFINNNKNLTKCQKTNLISLRNNLNNIYVDKESGKQINTYFMNSQNDLLKMTKFKLMLNHFFNETVVNILIKKMTIDKDMSDNDIIEFIKKYMNKKFEIKKNKLNKINKCNKWKYIFENLSMSYSNLLLDDENGNNKVKKYLDLGCGDGKKTGLLGREFNLNKDNIYGTDIKKWGPYEKVHSKHDFHFKYMGKDGKINYEDNTFDIISCFFVLHHIKNLDFAMSEIKRVLKPGGVMILLEHDNHDDFDNLLLDILHLFYGIFVDKNDKYLKKPDYAQYHNFMEWDFIFNNYGMKYVKSNYLFQEISHDIRYDNIYYTFYKNIK